VVQDLTTDHGDEEERNPTKTMETKKCGTEAKKDRWTIEGPDVSLQYPHLDYQSSTDTTSD
jgi:hypothetical protein